MMDEVDRIVAAWRHERPDLDVSPMEILSRVSRLSRQLDRARKSSFSDYGIESWAFDVLSALRRSGEPYQLSPSTLLQETLVTSGTMTNRIDRLVTAGWVERLPDPDDRRGVLVRLTEAGRATVDSALADLLVKERDILAGLTPAGRRKLASLLRELSTGFDGDED
ncbi:MarR family transcriptional regulator [Brevibacterium sp. XM4083]|uniref:MarR family transcriptional regulator n=2 Tax=Brevibacteriaceae TaxID=85019 RepID=A0A7T4A2L5_9MICO|nr:MarR family transcriptional regulator [Brevibacterium sp. XM4083]QQB16188.1 MarR family transcriptional regulator [Brevibacterium casei]